jgi:predicted Zn-dependent peptidase
MGKMKRRYNPRNRRRPKFHQLREIVSKETEQVQIVVGLPCSSFKDELRFEAFIVNGMLGGGMTSKLYQSVREKRGLAYTIYSQLVTFTDIGTIAIYAGTDAKQAKGVLNLIEKCLADLRRKRINESDLKLYKTQIRGGILLGADDVENRMSSLGVNEMVFGEYRPVDEVVSEIESVTVKSIKQFIERYVSSEKAACMIMGPIDEKKWKWPKGFSKN